VRIRQLSRPGDSPACGTDGLMSTRRGKLRVGTSGYQYSHWRGVFYPDDLPKSRWFEYYARAFDTVEINFTFYRLPAPHVFDAWREAAPSGHLYALKFSRYATHRKRLKDPAESIVMFLERARRLGPLLGPILVQLPPTLTVDMERLDAFLRLLPQPPRWTVEFRDRSWLCQPVFALLERHRVALCVHDMVRMHPQRLTADFTYWRFHGAGYRTGYRRQVLSAYARRLRALLHAGIDVYAYFNNDIGGHAVHDAAVLRRYLEGDRQQAVA
jgi:uncharacterized protein YecE (DUF72 family)